VGSVSGLLLIDGVERPWREPAVTGERHVELKGGVRQCWRKSRARRQ
jgi:hypothetical protein